MTPKLEMRTSQALVMTPQLMQAIKLLQLSNVDLVAHVETELERNPLLVRDESDERGPGEGNEAADRGDASSDAASSDTSSDGGPDSGSDSDGPDLDTAPLADALTSGADANVSDLDADFGSVYAEDGPSDSPAPVSDPGALAGSSWSQVSGRGGSADDFDLDAVLGAEKSMQDHLADQLVLAVSDPAERMIGQYLIDMIDEAGYLTGDVETMAEQLGTDPETVERVLAVVQSFDPSGIGARSLAECLALQLKERDRLDPAMKALVDNLEILARRDFSALRRICGVDEEDLVDMIGEIRALNPKPGNAFGAAVVQTVVPDVIVRPSSSGGWAIELNTETLPKVLVDQTYYTTVSRAAVDDKAKTYLSDCLQTANWLVKSLDQRARTILKVSTEIVRQQDGFLANGVAYLKPLNLRTVAEAINMHESTVSRVTSNKYMATPRGIFELKYFFTSAIASAEGGEAHSAEAVRHQIRRLIDAENPEAILSDDTIVKMLRDSGVDIARRTVAKYRESMRIPSSVQRRREKRALQHGAA
ncbi:RNA polymerase sigma-54 factor [Rhodobium gokarnense]|uniref:RNA polymerase sigma-54 factor n=2 Tax=Rhodobium gokarnense TaxID=364296 RepID=A0ABT3HGX1_9HYPH|nr:RNA polymerase sigma-54 factor [Rhodobium gokarnense]